MGKAAKLLPHVNVTPEDERVFRQLSLNLENEVLEQYEQHLFKNNRVVDESKWRPLRTHHDLHTYRERDEVRVASGRGPGARPRPASSDSSSSTSSTRSLSEVGSVTGSAQTVKPQAAMAAELNIPFILLAGSIPGRLDDAMLGISFHDTHSLRERTVYENDVVDECAVLSVIDEATSSDPFRFLGIVWKFKKHPLVGLVRSRDILVLAQIHMSQLSNGERVGVIVYHSIKHRDLPTLEQNNIVRLKKSLVKVFRQLDDGHVDVYVMGFADPMSRAPEVLVPRGSTRKLLSISKVCDTAVRRKLLWLLRTQQRAPPKTEEQQHAANNRICHLCDSRLDSMFSTDEMCQLCTSRVCSKCVVAKKIVLPAPHNNIEVQQFTFCIGCSMQVRRYSSSEFAREVLYDRRRIHYNSQARKNAQTPSNSSVGSSN